MTTSSHGGINQMRGTFARRSGIVLVALALTVMTAGTAFAASSTAASSKLKPATLNASGATFPLGFYQVAIGDFKQAQKSVSINYGGGGSGKGRQEFTDKIVEFAGTDAVFKPEDAAKVTAPFFYFPTVAAPITVSYNLEGVERLNLSADTIANIFQRKIKTWDDAAIKADNPKAKLPSTAITVARRSDSSGTTENFTTFLTKAAPTTWTLGKGSTVAWPSDTTGASGNAGVAKVVSDTDGAIGYVDFSDAVATGLTFANVKNAAGKFITPTSAAASLALEGATVNADLTYDPINASGAKAYPITAPTWLLVYKTQTDAAKGAALKGFLNFLYKEGQVLAPQVDYSPLSKGLLKQAKAQVNQIVVPAAS
ncbi:MAG: phosphate ABC transporter substrate-binding protein PstS [Acidimicrobiia bacterium]